jgi:small ligand-binding sensory domain FIST
MGDLQFSRGFQWIDDSIVTRSAAALAIGGVRMDTIQMHGCRPSGRYRTVTAADGNLVLEIDGRPALEVVAEMLGPDTDGTSWEDYPIFVTFGINNGDKFGPFREDDYAVRLCSAVDKARGGLAFFGDDLQPGQEFQLMRRSFDFNYMQRRVAELMSRIDGRRPLLALYIDCAGRCSAMTGTEGEEATEIQKALGDRVPLLGWYVGGEIARAGSIMQSHNWTGVLSILSEERA